MSAFEIGSKSETSGKPAKKIAAPVQSNRAKEIAKLDEGFSGNEEWVRVGVIRSDAMGDGFRLFLVYRKYGPDGFDSSRSDVNDLEAYNVTRTISEKWLPISE